MSLEFDYHKSFCSIIAEINLHICLECCMVVRHYF